MTRAICGRPNLSYLLNFEVIQQRAKEFKIRHLVAPFCGMTYLRDSLLLALPQHTLKKVQKKALQNTGEQVPRVLSGS